MTIFLFSLFLNSTSIQAQSQTPFFQDIQGHWGESYINALHENCGITGYKDNGVILHKFGPNNYLTRAELAEIIMKCHKNQEQTVVEEKSYFKDVKSSDWFFHSVTQGTKLGWWKGYESDQTFRPYQNVIRPEGLKMILLSKVPETEITDHTVNFNDVPVSHWSYKYVAYVYNKGYINGFSDGTFGTYRNMTRAEAATIIVKIFGFPVPEGTTANQPGRSYPSNPDSQTGQGPQGTPIQTTGTSPMIAGCPIFPPDNPWNTDISNYPVHPNSQNFIQSILNGRQYLHPDFGGNGEYGIPFTVVDSTTPKVNIIASEDEQTDPGPYPIPDNITIEGGGDRHILVIEKDNCILYETYRSIKNGSGWEVGSGAIFDLRSNALRPDGWTSADAAGLPILAGLVRYDEVKSGSINHALRFTVSRTQKGYIHPATHHASDLTNPNLPPMGLRLRLKQDFDISKYTGDTRVILEALKKYGMIVADNGSDWFISGEMNPNWNDDDLRPLKTVPGSAFEVVDTGPILK